MSHRDEEDLMRKASAIRAEAMKMREERLNANSEANRKVQAEEKAKSLKERRDGEIRKMLLPLATELMKSGYRIKNNTNPYNTFIATQPVMRLIRTNAYPNTPIDIYWKDGFTEFGFYWE